jgi:hypothetical protein
MIRKQILEEWNHRRTALAHDLLKNQISPSISKLSKVISGDVYDPLFIEEFFQTFISQVNIVDAEIEWLVSSAQDALSPRQLFNLEPLMNLDMETKAWLPDVIHDLWRANICLSDELERATYLCLRVKEATEKFSLAYSNELDINLTIAANQLRTEFNELVTHISMMSRLTPYAKLS